MNAIEQVLTSAGWLVLDWSVRWGLLIALLALWLAWRPPRRSEVRHALAWGVLFVGLGLPLTPLWGPGFWPARPGLARVAPGPAVPPRAERRPADAASATLEHPARTGADAVRERRAGDVVDRESGQGLRNVRLTFRHPLGHDGRHSDDRSTTTDDRGEYLVYTTAGKVEMYVGADRLRPPRPEGPSRPPRSQRRHDMASDRTDAQGPCQHHCRG